MSDAPQEHEHSECCAGEKAETHEEHAEVECCTGEDGACCKDKCGDKCNCKDCKCCAGHEHAAPQEAQEAS